MRETLQAYVAGLTSATVLILANYLLLGDFLFINLAPLPLMSVTISGLAFRHFLLSLAFAVAGVALAIREDLRPAGIFLLGVGLMLFIVDVGISHGVIDLIRTGQLAPVTQVYLLLSILFMLIVAALIKQVG